MNILSIGNSFSQDAHRYLHHIAKADGEVLKTFNLYIGGCSLYRHYKNMLTENAEYMLEMNGESTGFKVSVQEALLNREWDVVTLQQVSSQSTDYDKYQPYLNELVDLVKTCAPKAKIVIHQTWAYEEGSQKLCEVMGYNNQKDMFKDIKEAYSKAAKEIGADMVIPSGELFQKLLEAGIEKVHRDTYHATLGLGRYALGLLWYRLLTGKAVLENTFADFDEEVSAENILTAKKCVEELCK